MSDQNGGHHVIRTQTRTVSTLMGSQMLGGLGVSSGIAVASITAYRIVESESLAGLANTAQVLGAAVLVVPVARIMDALGRRTGLLAGYVMAALGGTIAILGGALSSLWVLLAGTFLFGAATAANNQSRYAATDLAQPHLRGRHLSLVVWATTIGAVLGPNLSEPSGRVVERFGLDPLAGAFAVSTLGFVLAAGLLWLMLRPDPLLLAREISTEPPRTTRRSIKDGLALAWANETARLGLLGVALGHTVMVAIMVMTPVHMDHGHASLRLVGLVISIHVLGMYAFSPVTGWMTDRLGARAVILIGAVTLLAAAVVSGQAPVGWSYGLVVGLFLLGLGWSCTMVAGSSLLAGAVPLHDRPSVQGAGDMITGLCAAAGGALAGPVVAHLGFVWLCAGSGALAVLCAVIALRANAGRRVPHHGKRAADQ